MGKGPDACFSTRNRYKEPDPHTHSTPQKCAGKNPCAGEWKGESLCDA